MIGRNEIFENKEEELLFAKVMVYSDYIGVQCARNEGIMYMNTVSVVRIG